VAVKIKLKRLGKIREPYYRIVVADARTKRDGRAIEEIGKYHPKAEPSLIEVNSERVQHWLSVGAQPTDPVRVLLKITGDWQKFTGEPGTEGTLRTAEPRADKKERFTAAAKESQASKEDKAAGQTKAQSRAARPSRDGAARDGTTRDSTAKDSAAKDGAAKDSAAKDTATRASTTKAGPAKSSTAKASTPKTSSAKDDASSVSQPGDEQAAAKPARTRAARSKAPEGAAEDAATVTADAAGDAGQSADGEPGSGA
jgi:small subunit ribosomal protein S16